MDKQAEFDSTYRIHKYAPHFSPISRVSNKLIKQRKEYHKF